MTPPKALRRIEACKKTKNKELDLSGCELTVIPNEIADLVWLEKLSLYGNQISAIAGLEKLVNLTELSLSENQISALAGLEKLVSLKVLDLSKNNISAIAGLENLENLKVLDLSKNHISAIDGLENLVNLSVLYLYNNQISSIAGLELLVNISRLHLSENQISAITGLETLVNLSELSLYNNQISAIAGLETLVNLKRLYLSGNQISAITSLEKLVNLTELYISRNQISVIAGLGTLVNLFILKLSYNKINEIAGLEKLINLSELSLDGNQISTIAGLEKLVNLFGLYLSGNQIKAIAGLEKLKKLDQIILANNQIEDIKGLTYWLEKGIPIELVGYSTNLKKINLHNNPLKKPDVSIVKLGNEAILNYFKQLEEQGGTVPLYEAKLIVVGEPGAGKTTLTEKLIHENHVVIADDPDKKSTLGINIKENWWFEDCKRPNETFTAHIWDFGGQEIQYMTHQFFLTPESLYVLVADDRKQHTLFPYWFEVIHLLGKAEDGSYSPILVVLNERNNKSISNFDLNEYRKKYPNTFIQQLEVDLGDEDLRRFRIIRAGIQDALCNLKHLGTPLPAKWPLIREKITTLNDTQNYINWQTFTELCASCQVTHETDQKFISKYLHRLGAILHFQDDTNLYDFVVINPSWALKAIYLILENKTVIKNHGRFSESNFEEYWAELKKDERRNVLDLMKKDNFEICYPVGNQTYIAPQLLPAIRPDFDWDSSQSLKYQFYYRFMPKGIMTRLIVRKHEYLSDIVWARGAIFNRYDCEILVTEEETDKNGLIAIEVIGKPSQRIEALSFIKNEIKEIHDKWFPTINFDERIPCHCEDCKGTINPSFFEESRLTQRIEQNIETIECEKKKIKKVNVVSLLHGVYNESTIKQILLVREGESVSYHKIKEEQETKLNKPESVQLPKTTPTLMENMKKNWLFPVIILFGLYLVFIKFAPNGSKFDILGIFKGEKGVSPTKSEDEQKPKKVTVRGFIKINGKYAKPSEVKYVRILKSESKSELFNDGSFMFDNVGIPTNKFIPIEVVMKDDWSGSEPVKINDEPDADQVYMTREILLFREGFSKTKPPKSSITNPVIIIKNQNIQNNGGELKNNQ